MKIFSFFLTLFLVRHALIFTSNMSFGLLSPESAEIFDEFVEFSRRGIVEDAISDGKIQQNCEKIADSQGINPKTQGSTLQKSAVEVNEKFHQYIQYSSDQPNLIGYLSLEKDRPIDSSSYLYVKFALEDFKKRGVRFVIFNLDTPGGEVFAAMQISQLLQRLDTQDHIPVVAFIDNWAISAGAMIAYSCRFIGATNTASMGAAEPVLASGDGKMESASEKINSALRSEFSNLASFYGRNPLLAEAMVDKDIILVLRQGEIVKLENENQIDLSSAHPDLIITGKGKLLTLNAQELIRLGVADFVVSPTSLPSISNEEKSKQERQASKNLLFQEPFFQKIPQATLIGYHDWRISFFAFLAHPLVSSLLFMGLILGIYLELSHPGLGAPAILALVCLGLILLSSFAAQTVNWLEIIILCVGVALLFVEIFFLPGFGLAGILGILLVIAGLFTLMLPSLEGFHFTFDAQQINLVTKELLKRLAFFSSALVLSLVIMFILARFFSNRFSLFHRIVLKSDQPPLEEEEKERLPDIASLGIAWTPLRPSGKVEILGKIYDAVSEGGFVEKGEEICVVRKEGSRILVRKSSVS